MTAVQPVPAIAAGSMNHLGQVIAAYNRVTEQLKESHDRLMAEVARLRAELESKNRQLERRRRLAALGEMAAGVAHEIRNPLGSIQLYADLLGRQLPADSRQANLAGRIRLAVTGLDAIVSDMLTFTRDVQADRRPTPLAALVAESAGDASARLADANVELRTEIPAGMLVELDRGLFKRVLVNLMLNAADAMAATDAGSERVLTVTASAEPGGGWRIAVADTGPGVRLEVIDRIFNPFFTTKSTGTGLGLAIVHHIVEAHGGTITAANRPDGGAVFTILLSRQGSGVRDQGSGAQA